MVPRLFGWMYRKLGRQYPAVFLIAELQLAFLVAAGTLGIFSFYYPSVASDFLLLFAITAVFEVYVCPNSMPSNGRTVKYQLSPRVVALAGTVVRLLYAA